MRRVRCFLLAAGCRGSWLDSVIDNLGQSACPACKFYRYLHCPKMYVKTPSDLLPNPSAVIPR